jgi:UDPglucose--hexose-1-phosphate uridylyltransferase
VSQLRLNPLTGRWVTIVSDRGERPTDFAPRLAQVESDPLRPCPFCADHAPERNSPILERAVDGKWLVRVVPNKYPAFRGDDSMAVRNLGPVHVQAEASGAHEVFVMTPDHDGSWATLDDPNATAVMMALRDRFADHALMPHVRYTQAIVNQGREAGASLSHPHGQLLGMPFVPGEILDEERAFGRFEGGCILCATIEAESQDGARVVFEDDNCLVICPFWSGEPYELLVIPRTHEGHMRLASDDDLASVGIGIRNVLESLEKLIGGVAYNLVFHTSPHQHLGSHFHWHAHIWPKLTTVAGFERGTGVMINITPPEYAANQLRRVRQGS